MATEDYRFSAFVHPIYILSDYREFAPHEYHLTRTITEYVLLIMSDGILTFTENDKEITLTKGEWYIQHPRLKQSALRESQCPSYFYIHFSLPDEEENSDKNFFRNLTRGKCDYKLYESFFKELALPMGHTITEALEKQALFMNFLSFFLQTCGIDNFKQKSKPVQSIIEYLKLNYMNKINISQISDRFHYSAEYVYKLFKKETGITIPSYIKNLRMEKAVILLQNTNTPVAEISQELGYEDVSVFFRNFKSTYGLSPRAFRQSFQD